MSLEIYKNNQDQILFGSSGNVFRRPYDFGNAFYDNVGIQAYIQISGLNISTEFTALLWRKFSSIRDNPANGIIDLHFNSDDNILLYSYSATSPASPSIITYSNSSNINAIPGNESYYDASSLISISTDSTRLVTTKVNKGESTSSVQYTGDYIDQVRIGVGTRSTGNALTYYSLNEDQSNRFTLFDRELINNEYLYCYNNGSGSELLSKLGCVVDIYNNKAEILDFSTLQNGSDMRVGARDYSGNNYHGEIMNLPAGTIQEQLDYANANLFVPFIS